MIEYAGDTFESIVWRTPNPPSKEEVLLEAERVKNELVWKTLRLNRNQKLTECDWTQVADAPVDQQAWAEYRQALRDLPENTIDPENPVWPVPPES
jgi:hypothetical protein